MRIVQATAVVAVAGLFSLLAWKLTHQTSAAKIGGPVPNFAGRVAFVGIDYHDVTSDGPRFLRTHDVTYPTVQDGAGKIGDRYGLTLVPETFVINADGRLPKHIPGTLTVHRDPFMAATKAALKP